jgi:hypothetical protein
MGQEEPFPARTLSGRGWIPDLRRDLLGRQGSAVSRPSDRPLLAGFGHNGHSLFIGGQLLVSHLDFDGEFCCDA